MRKEETNAIRRLERAFKVCSELGIKFVGMDGNLLFATESALEGVEARHFGDYNEIAIVCRDGQTDGAECINTHGAFIDSGGY